ncbi:hypothetical protein YB2330_006348 [Saitoella coloradoensis]
MRFLQYAMATLAVAAATEAYSTYDRKILSDSPVLYLCMDPATSSTVEGNSTETDLSGSDTKAVYNCDCGTMMSAHLPNGDKAVNFTGTQYLEVASSPNYSIPTTGGLTLEAWIAPSTLQFADDESTGYVHWLSKGTTQAPEWVLRIYSYNNTESRPNRISAYAFNQTGGFGSGSYFQDAVTVNQWIHVVGSYNQTASTKYPRGYVKIYKNGILRGTTGLDQYNTIPWSGTDPLRVGTRDFRSFFEGAIGKVAVYPRELDATTIMGHYEAMTSNGTAYMYSY